MKRRTKSTLALGIAAAMLGASSLMAHDGDDNRGRDRDGRFVVRAELVGLQEVPALSTTAHGRFRAVVDTEANTITFKLTYDALEGTVQQAHVHFGQKSVNGGVSFFLCSNLGNGPAGTQACPAPPAEVTGVIDADPRARARGTGHRGRGIRRDRRRHQGRNGLRERPYDEVAGRRNPRPAALTDGYRAGLRSAL